MFLVDSDCSKEESEKEVGPLLELFKEEEEYSISVIWADRLAYPIKQKIEAHRYLVNFTTSDYEKLEKFKNLSLLNPKILRHLIINMEKTYGYRRSINPKKVAYAERKAKKYQEFKEKRQKSLKNFNR